MSDAQPHTAPGMRILVVDDEAEIGDMIRRALEHRGYSVDVARDVREATRRLDAESYDGLLLDLRLAGEDDGLAVLEHVRSMPMPPITVMMSAFADIPGVTDAMRRGAVDFIEKPFRVNDLVSRVERALQGASSQRRVATHGPIAVSAAMKRVFALADRVASTPASSALIVGESGVGKEIVATRIHEGSERRAAPFVRVNLAAIPESMVEAELFGSIRGAFTDSKRDRAGLLASAEGGTLLLDEITEFRVDLQPKLLRVLEERRYFPLGSDRERPMNVRVLASTNRSPDEAIEQGRLRHDLYYRISTVMIEVPPLRHRQDDLIPLAEHFLGWFAAEFGRSVSRFTPDAVMKLHSHEWSGNVRELRNVIERAVIMCDGPDVTANELCFSRTGSSYTKLPQTLGDAKQKALQDVERKQIQRALEISGGNRTTAAQLLGISRTTLWETLKTYGM